MAENAKRWLAEFRVKSGLGLREDQKTLDYSYPKGEYDIQIRNAPEDGVEGENLTFNIVFPAPDIEAAEDISELLLRKFLHVVSFVTNSRFQISRRIHLTDWTKGVSERYQYVYAMYYFNDPEALLAPDLLETARRFHSLETTSVVESALRWYSAGVQGDVMEDQFQYFWFAIELIAVAFAPTDKVADKCQDQKCGGDLYCEKCGRPSKHPPFRSQRIRLLLTDLNLSPKSTDTLFDIRNRLMHAEPREQIEASIQADQPDFTFEKAVNRIAETAWMLILNTFKIPFDLFNDDGEHEPSFIEVSTHVTKRMVGKVHMIIGAGKDPDNPRIEDLYPLPTFTLRSSDGTKTKEVET